MTGALKNQNGSALIFTLLVLVILTVLGLAAGTTTNFELQLASSERDYQGALYAAEAGIAAVRAAAKTNFGSFQDGAVTEGRLPPYSYRCEIDQKGAYLFDLVSTGMANGVTATVVALVEANPSGSSPGGYTAQAHGGSGKNSSSNDLKPISDMTVQDLSF